MADDSLNPEADSLTRRRGETYLEFRDRVMRVRNISADTFEYWDNEGYIDSSDKGTTRPDESTQTSLASHKEQPTHLNATPGTVEDIKNTLIEGELQSISSPSDHGGLISSIAVSPNGERCLSADGLVVRNWDIEAGKQLLRYQKHKDEATKRYGSVAMAFSPEGDKVASLGEQIHLWEAETGELLSRFDPEPGRTKDAKTIAFLPSGRDVFCGTQWGKYVVNLDECSLLLSAQDGGEGALSASGDWAIISHSEKMSEWKLKPVSEEMPYNQRSLFAQKGDVFSLAVSNDGFYALSSGDDAIVYSQSGKSALVTGSDQEKQLLRTPEWSSGTQRDYLIYLWNIGTQKELRVFGQRGSSFDLEGPHEHRIKDLAFSPDGSLFLSCGGVNQGRVCLWETASGKLLRSITTKHTVSSVAFSPDGRRAFFADDCIHCFGRVIAPASQTRWPKLG